MRRCQINLQADRAAVGNRKAKVEQWIIIAFFNAVAFLLCQRSTCPRMEVAKQTPVRSRQRRQKPSIRHLVVAVRFHGTSEQAAS
jgi:hypothetical protein